MPSFLDYFLPQNNGLVPQNGMLPQDQRDAANFQGLLGAGAALADMSAPQAGPQKTLLQMVTGGLQGYGGGVQNQLNSFYDSQKKQAEVGYYNARAMGGAGDKPANIREWEMFSSMTPDEQRQYLNMKRADQVLNLGGQQVVRSPMGGISEAYAVTPRPEQMPAFQGQQEAAKLQEQSNYAAPIASAKAQGQVIGEDIGNARANLGKVEQDGQSILATLDSIENHPGLPAVVGMPNPLEGGLGIANVPGSRAADFQAKLEQVKGQQFLQAFNTLRGGGAISEKEGEKATNAIASMQTAQSEQQFKKSLGEFRTIVNTGLQRARQKAGANGQPSLAADEAALQRAVRPLNSQQRLRYNPQTGALE